MRNAILDKTKYKKMRDDFNRIVSQVSELDEDRLEVEAMKFCFYLTELRKLANEWTDIFFEIPDIKMNFSNIVSSSVNCLLCGLNPLRHVRDREYFCTVCEKRVIISCEDYSLGNCKLEDFGDTLIVTSRQ